MPPAAATMGGTDVPPASSLRRTFAESIGKQNAQHSLLDSKTHGNHRRTLGMEPTANSGLLLVHTIRSTKRDTRRKSTTLSHTIHSTDDLNDICRSVDFLPPELQRALLTTAAPSSSNNSTRRGGNCSKSTDDVQFGTMMLNAKIAEKRGDEQALAKFDQAVSRHHQQPRRGGTRRSSCTGTTSPTSTTSVEEEQIKKFAPLPKNNRRVVSLGTTQQQMKSMEDAFRRSMLKQQQHNKGTRGSLTLAGQKDNPLNRSMDDLDMMLHNKKGKCGFQLNFELFPKNNKKAKVRKICKRDDALIKSQ